jgi:hypothetical protein
MIGLALARRLLRRARRDSLVVWSLRGIAAGTLLGPLGVCSWFELLNIATPADFVAQIPELLIAGVGCGAPVGLAVGVQCWRTSRRLAPPPLTC